MKTVDQMLVTPEQAESWYAMSSGNRHIRKAVVVRYADEMSRGRWGFNHQGYLIDQRGGTVDGHHRQLAQAESGAAIRVNVTFLEAGDPVFSALDSEIDRGATRNDADVTGLPKRTIAICNAIPILAKRWLGGGSRKKSRAKLLPSEQVRLSRVVEGIMRIGSAGRFGMTSVVQSVFICAIHGTADKEIERQWDILISDEELPGKWPMAAKVLRDMNNERRIRVSKYATQSGGRTEVSDRMIALWWLALQPKFRERGSLSGTKGYLVDARISVAREANKILEIAGIMASGNEGTP